MLRGVSRKVGRGAGGRTYRVVYRVVCKEACRGARRGACDCERAHCAIQEVGWTGWAQRACPDASPKVATGLVCVPHSCGGGINTHFGQ